MSALRKPPPEIAATCCTLCAVDRETLSILRQNFERARTINRFAKLAFLDRLQLHVNRRDVDLLLLAAADRRQRVGNAGQFSHVGRNAFGQREVAASVEPSGARTLISNCD
jgi:hypothetical protein